MSLIREYRTLLHECEGGNVKVPYQEDLRKWVKGPEGAAKGIKELEEDRRKWTKEQAENLYQEVGECTLPELEVLCKKKGILIWSIKYYTPDFFRAVIKKSRTSAIQDIIEEIGTAKWYSSYQLKVLLKRKNEEYALNRYHGEISYDDIKEYDPDWFSTVFKKRFVTLPDIIEKDGSPPQYRKVLD